MMGTLKSNRFARHAMSFFAVLLMGVLLVACGSPSGEGGAGVPADPDPGTGNSGNENSGTSRITLEWEGTPGVTYRICFGASGATVFNEWVTPEPIYEEGEGNTFVSSPFEIPAGAECFTVCDASQTGCMDCADTVVCTR